MDGWNGLFAPAGTSEAIVAKANPAVAQALRDPAVVAKMAPTGTVLSPTPTPEFVAWLARQRETIERLIRDANITLTS